MPASTGSVPISYTVEIQACMPEDCVPYMDQEKFKHLCRSGCPNYAHKWSCPPFAPSYTNFALKWKHLWILLIRTEMTQFSYIKNDYLKVKAANTMLKSRADRFLRSMAEKHGACISTGSCRLCKPCKCKLKMPCAHPEQMAYSFEALGVNVSQLTEHFFAKQLLWYQTKQLPKYTAVVCGILTNEILSAEYLQMEYQKRITS